MLEMSLTLIALKSPICPRQHFSILQMSRECLKALSGFSPIKPLRFLLNIMITIKRHVNLDNWIEVRFFNKLLDQFTSSSRAYAFARDQAEEKRVQVYNFDKDVK